MVRANDAPGNKKGAMVLFILLLYAGCFIIYYALAYTFYALIAGPDIYAPVASCAVPSPGGKGLCPTLIALQAQFVSPWFFGGLVVTVGTLIVWRLRRRRQ